MELVKSLGTPSKDVFSTHYYGGTSPVNIALNGYTQASVELFPLSFGWTNKPGINIHNRHELMDYSIDLTEIGDYAVFATTGNKYALPKRDMQKYGYALPPCWDESGNRMDGWLAEKGMIEYVKPNPEIGMWEWQGYTPSYSRDSAMPDVNVPIHRWDAMLPINKFGFYTSKVANAWEHSMGLINSNDVTKRPGFDNETVACLESMLNEGLGPGRRIIGYGVENLKNAAAKIYRTNGNAILVESKYIYQKAVAIAQAQGLVGKAGIRQETIDEIIRYFLKHELTHNFNRSKASESQEEIAVGEFLAKFYKNRAGIVNEKLARIYRALAEENKAYAENWRKGKVSSRLRSMVAYLSEKYEAEARAMGMDEEKARDYAANKLEQEAERLENSDLEETVEGQSKEAKSGKGGKNKAESREASDENSERKVSKEGAQEKNNESPETADAPAEEG